MVVYAKIVSIQHIYEYKSICDNQINVLTKPKIENTLNNHAGIQCNCSGKFKIYSSVAGFYSHMNSEKHKSWHTINILKFELKHQKEKLKQLRNEHHELQNTIEEHEETIGKLKKKYTNKKEKNIELKKAYHKSLNDIQKYKTTYISDSD